MRIGHRSTIVALLALASFFCIVPRAAWAWNDTGHMTVARLAWDDANLRFVDLDGDGRADVLITEHDALTWYPSLADDGFDAKREVPKAADEERGPRVVFADGTQSIHLADMSGDGLQDLVRIRNGEVCYWPSLGHGRFGAKVTMSGAPRLDYPYLFDQRRVRLADVDGSGTTEPCPPPPIVRVAHACAPVLRPSVRSAEK
jgi:hypothetical protein